MKFHKPGFVYLVIEQPPLTRHSLVVFILLITGRRNSFISTESVGESLHIGLDWALRPQELHVGAVDLHLALLAFGEVLLAAQRREAPVLRHDDLLLTRELVLRAAKGFDGSCAVCQLQRQYETAKPLGKIKVELELRTGVAGANGEQDLANVDAGDSAVGLAPGAPHPGLQPIGAGARQHFVDADDVVRVGADAEVETFLSGDLD